MTITLNFFNYMLAGIFLCVPPSHSLEPSPEQPENSVVAESEASPSDQGSTSNFVANMASYPGNVVLLGLSLRFIAPPTPVLLSAFAAQVVFRNIILPSLYFPLSQRENGFLRGNCGTESGVVLFALSSEDWNGSSLGLGKIIDDIEKSYAIYFVRLNSSTDLLQALTTLSLKCNAKIPSLIIYGHASKSKIQLGNDFLTLTKKPDQFSETLMETLKPDASIILIACNTGLENYDGLSMAQTIAVAAPGRRVYAPAGAGALVATRIYSTDGALKAHFAQTLPSVFLGYGLASHFFSPITSCFVANNIGNQLWLDSCEEQIANSIGTATN